jgi:hypothetical protein
MNVKETASDAVGVIGKKTTLAAVAAVVGENIAEKALFKGFPGVFGIAANDSKGNLQIKPAKPNGSGGWVPQTADSPKPFWYRQGARAGIAVLCFAAGLTSKDEALQAGFMTGGFVALAHIAQDAHPVLRG